MTDQNEKCKHDRWIVKGCDTLGFATCLICGEEVNMSVLFNSLHDRMEEALKRVGDLGNDRP